MKQTFCLFHNIVASSVHNSKAGGEIHQLCLFLCFVSDLGIRPYGLLCIFLEIIMYFIIMILFIAMV